MQSKKISAELPPKNLPLDGTVEVRRVKCGRANCRCAKGELHGPYTYVRVYKRGKRWRTYIKNDDVSALSQARTRRQAAIEQAKRERAAFRQQWQELKQLLRSL